MSGAIATIKSMDVRAQQRIVITIELLVKDLEFVSDTLVTGIPKERDVVIKQRLVEMFREGESTDTELLIMAMSGAMVFLSQLLAKLKEA